MQLQEYEVRQVSNGYLLIERDYEGQAVQTYYSTRLEAYEALAAVVAEQVETSKPAKGEDLA